jgi:hypothetical protein
MQTATAAATSLKVAATLPSYSGPLGRFLHRQTEARAAAATLVSMRANVLGLLDDYHVFTDAERATAAAAVALCPCVARLQRWFRNVYRLRTERETSLRMAFADGSYCHIPVHA